jgi:uncharacterized protein
MTMTSKTRLLELVRGFEWRGLEAALLAEPRQTAFVDERRRNLLHLCCSAKPKPRRLRPQDSVKTAAVLLAAGIDVNQEAFSEGNWKATPLWYAVARGENLLLAKYLLEHGASPEHCLWAAAYRDDVVAIELLVEHGARIDPVTEDETPFLSAVKGSHFRAAAALLRLGADANFQDSRGMTALHYMLKKASPERHFWTIIERGARGDLPNQEGVTAEQIMSRKRSPVFRKMVEELSAPRKRRPRAS